MKDITDILGASLPADLVESIKQSFDAKIEEARREIEAQVESDLARRFDRDRDTIIKSIDQMISEALIAQENEKAEEIGKYTEARVAYHKSMVEGKKLLTKKMKESLTAASGLIDLKLNEEVEKLRAERRAMIARTEAMASELKEAKQNIAKNHEAHVQKIDEFVTKHVRAELMDFAQDKNALVEQRVKMVAEGRKKLMETQQRFITEAASKVEKFVEENLRANLADLHEDIERNRQAHFGQEIFKAFVAEFMASHYADDTEARKLQNVVESKDAEVAAAKTALELAEQKLIEANAKVDQVSRKVQFAEERVERTKIMSELLSPLKGEKRAVMENLLGTTKTTELRKAFNRLLPVVLSETTRKSETTSAVINEGKTKVVENRTVTGDRVRNPRLVESENQQMNAENQEIALIKHLAGLR